ncbi:hypothetical protein AB0L75_36725 [Streptomyces sp. NPDC052101]|uniref:hypothetical protein n=1 Tax=Streptomyces sp. NPDC052101 TaxID=3155763 RepID=UPI0034246F75
MSPIPDNPMERDNDDGGTSWMVQTAERRINRPRGQLAGVFQELEYSLGLDDQGPLVLLTGCQTAAALRRTGRTRLTTRLRHRKVRGAGAGVPPVFLQD